MRDLPGPLRWYLWGVTLIAATFTVLQLLAVRTLADPSSLVVPALLCGLGAFWGERLELRISQSLWQGLSSTAYVAALLLLPTPAVVAVTLGATVVAQALIRGQPLFKRAFNVAHITLAAGLTSALLMATAAPVTAMSSTRLAVTWPLLLLLVGVWYTLETGMVVALFSLRDGQAPWRVWWHRYRRAALPELATGTTGIVVAALWLYWPPLPLLLLVPVIGIRGALRAIGEAEERAEALRRRGVQMEAVLAAGDHGRLRHPQGDLLLHVAAGAQAVLSARAVAAYAPDSEQPGVLERLALYPQDAATAGPTHLDGHTLSPAIREEVEGDEWTVLLPLRTEGSTVVSLLRVMGVPRALDADDRDVLAVLATQATTSLENAQLHARALAQASEDSLTGLLNHRAFQDRTEQEVARARRGGHPLAVVMIDLDGFGAINNAHGHQAGDVTLVAVARCLRAQTRQGDVAARYGGDEFVLILPETDLDEAVSLAERIREELARLTMVQGPRAIHVTASVGVAAMPDHATTREHLIGAADRASYAAKRAGKNRVRQAEAGALPLDAASLAAQLDDTNLATVEMIAAAVDAKDAYTRGHSGRVSGYAAAIAGALGLPEADIARIRQAGLLHDVGKIGVPDAILLKPGALSDEEFAVIKEHPAIGEHILQGLPFLAEILPAVRHHHERWDGHGYPDGLAGEAIPLDAAILAVADSFDAMTSSRTYRVALSVSEAIRRVREGAGAQYDPRLVAAFDRALADGTLTVPVIRTGELRALPPRLTTAPSHAGGERSASLRIVG